MGLPSCIAVVASLISGCAAPNIDFGNCKGTCEADADCPSDMECRAKYCVHPNMVGSCGVGGESSGGQAGSSGQAQSGGSSGSSGNSGAGNTTNANGGANLAGAGALSNVAGKGGNENQGGNTGSSGASIGGTAGSSATVGGTAGSSTTMGGGAGSAGGVAIAGGAAGLGGVGGVTSTGGGAGVSQAGASGWASAPSCSAPGIDAQELMACPGEKYSATLTATCGSNCEWSSDPLAELGLTLSIDGKLSGIVKKAGAFSFDVTVRDTVANCSATRQFTLLVNGAGVGNCPVIFIKDKTPNALAPASCRERSYSVAFASSGGKAPHAWEALSLPEGLVFNSMTQVVTGTATASGTLTLQITDGSSVVQKSFEVPLREKCWFGYISSESGANRLHLFDPLREERLQRPVSNSTNLSVEDFKFSPDGKFVAYRVKDTTGAYKLSLWQSPGWTNEQELNLGGSVTHYAWSNNSLVLAVAIATSSDTLLGGVSVAAVPDTPTVSGIQGLLSLAPVSAPVESEITWYGQDGYVAFHSPDDPDYPERLVHYVPYAMGGFTTMVTPGTTLYAPPVLLYSGIGGFFAAATNSPFLKFYGISTMPTQHGNVAVAPSGSYTASAVGGQLRLYRAFDSSDQSSDVAWAESTGCTSLLAWGKNQERLACVDGNASKVRIHTLNASNQGLPSVLVDGSQDYVQTSWSGNRRLMSNSGNWLALGTSEGIYLASLAQATPSVVWTAPPVDSERITGLSFSPDEKLLVGLSGGTLRLFDVSPSGGNGYPLGNIGANSEPCQEQWLTIPSWCGSSNGPARSVWSSNSQSIAFVMGDGSLIVEDLRMWPRQGSFVGIQATASCNNSCVGGFQFQP